jgi:hypothetical protein
MRRVFNLGSNEVMQLIDLVTYFRHEGNFEDFCKQHALNAESEVIEIYAQVPAGLESRLGFFPIEETEGQAEFLSDGVRYQTLFDFFYFLEVIKDANTQESLKDAELAQILMSCALKDG